MNSAEKTAALLKLLGLAPYVHGVTELGEKIGCSKSGTYKLLAALVQNGLAAQTLDRKYTLGPAVYILGKTYEDRIGLSRMIRPYLIRLRDLTGENASFSMLVGGKANLIYREESLQLVRVAGSVGQERPLYAGSTGKVLGAFQDEEEIRRRLMDEPLTPFTPRTITSPQALETIGIGAPVRDESGSVWAAISIGAPRMRVDDAKRERYIFLVTEIAAEMSRDLTRGTVGDSLK